MAKQGKKREHRKPNSKPNNKAQASEVVKKMSSENQEQNSSHQLDISQDNVQNEPSAISRLLTFLSSNWAIATAITAAALVVVGMVLADAIFPALGTNTLAIFTIYDYFMMPLIKSYIGLATVIGSLSLYRIASWLLRTQQPKWITIPAGILMLFTCMFMTQHLIERGSKTFVGNIKSGAYERFHVQLDGAHSFKCVEIIYGSGDRLVIFNPETQRLHFVDREKILYVESVLSRFGEERKKKTKAYPKQPWDQFYKNRLYGAGCKK